MFTLFRCFTDGCAAVDGSPLAAHLNDQLGWSFMVLYILVFLFVTIGLFNLIMAIFVDNVMESTRQRKQDSRGEDHAKMVAKLRQQVIDHFVKKDVKSSVETNKSIREGDGLWTSIKRFFGLCQATLVGESLYNQTNSLESKVTEEIIITRDVFYNWLTDTEMTSMLEELDIAIANKHDLFDVLDADLSGELGVDEVVTGLMKLRGPAEKSDVVAALLCVRVILAGFQDFYDTIQVQVSEMEDRMRTGFALTGVDISRHTPL